MDEARYEELLARLADGEATGEEARELAAALRADPERRRKLVEWLLLEVQLYKITAGARGAAQAAQLRRQPLSRRLKVWAPAAAAALLVGATAWWALLPATQAGRYELAAGAISAPRLEEQVPFQVTSLAPARLNLPCGAAVELQNGSQAVLHGRSEGARQTVELRAGAGRFMVPAGKGAFIVDTPLGSVTVVGTEFTVELRRPERKPKGESEMSSRMAVALVVAVVAGAVQVNYDGKSVVLSAGQKQAFAKEGEGGGPRRSQVNGNFLRLDGSNVVLEQRKGEGGQTAEVTVATNADTKVLLSAKWVEDATKTGEGGRPGRKLEGAAGALSDLVAGRRTTATVVGDVATEIVQMAEEPPRRREGGEGEGGGEVKPPREQRREGER